MRRDNVIQIRVSTEEKAEYEALAKAEGMKLSEWLRYLASQESMDVEQAEGYERSENKVLWSAPLTPSTADEIEDASSVAPSNPFGLPAATERAVEDQKRFKQMVAQLQARMTLPEAEEEARKRLGMD